MNLNRRDAFKVTAAGAAVVALAACSDSDDVSALPTSSSVGGPQVIASVSDVPVGTALKFTDPATGLPGYLMQPAAGSFVAYSAVCTHEGCIVEAAPDTNSFHCPCHGAKYDLASGEPNENTKGTLTAKPLVKLSVSVSGEDLILG